MSEKTANTANRLVKETSPYLLQHARNPVDWHPWGAEALERARQEDKPVLLSIGYSACHWCHVMAHESFEDLEISRLMNELFVNIKVDREERPDLDKIYQTIHYLLVHRNGGWPLTVFLTPGDRIPFFSGTYYPPRAQYGTPGFRDVLTRVADFYREHRQDVVRQNESLMQALNSMAEPVTANVALHAEPLELARRELEQSYEARSGGFSPAPKFPHPGIIDRLLRHWVHTSLHGRRDDTALDMVTHTLRKMASGGLYDQIGGGFFRYSVDNQWTIPHFEKMLYDNAQLLCVYGYAAAATGESLFRRIAIETGDWVLREMQSPEGGYYSSLDADSEGEEGRYYCWTLEEVRDVLDETEYRLFAPCFGLEQAANFQGKWHFYIARRPQEVGRQLGFAESESARRLEQARRKLLAHRQQRVRPCRDEKILTAWNALMIKGMTDAGRHLQHPAFVRSAERALQFIRRHLWRDKRLLATYKDGTAHLPAYLDDYAFLLDGILALLQQRWDRHDLEWVRTLADQIIEQFQDPRDGAFYFTAADHESLIYRPRPTADEAMPAGSGVAAGVLGRLGHLLGETRYLKASERAIRSAWPMIEQKPYAHGSLLNALEEWLYPPQLVILRGELTALATWHRRAAQPYSPRRLTLAVPEEEELPQSLRQKTASAGSVIAYVCTGTRCLSPIRAWDTFECCLKETEKAGVA